MPAKLLIRDRLVLANDAFIEMVVWSVSAPVRGSKHWFKYRLALIENEQCVLRYDNEAGKGDHKHIGEHEMPYAFVDLNQLQRDFFADVRQWRQQS
jgi:hypothetical protein